jgi:hypothetical protein
MAPFLPLFQRNVLLDFVNQNKVKEDTESIKEYFEKNNAEGLEQLLKAVNDEWRIYLNNLASTRHKKLFHTKKSIPNEDMIVEKYAMEGVEAAKELMQIKKANRITLNTCQSEVIESARKQYIDIKALHIPSPEAREQHLLWIITNLLSDIYYPTDFFKSEIFELESDFTKFPYKFLDLVLGPQQLYIWYLLFTKKGPENFFHNLEDVIVFRYAHVSGIFKMDVYGLLNLFLFIGNDANGCNRFFTRRMNNDIATEMGDLCSLVNSSGSEFEQNMFNDYFLTSPNSRCCIKNPLEKNELGHRPGLIEQAIYNHLVGNYSAAVNLLFPVIEGIIWDISVAEHLANGGVYSPDRKLIDRNLKSRQLINENGLPIVRGFGAPTVKEMLEGTRMREVFHAQFLQLFCSELYPEDRNPILHGNELDYNTPFQSARLLLVLEYLHTVIKEHKYHYPIQLDPQGYWTAEKSGTQQTAQCLFTEP